jgi:5-methylcytosine-specific restriction endonuclease McrA
MARGGARPNAGRRRDDGNFPQLTSPARRRAFSWGSQDRGHRMAHTTRRMVTVPKPLDRRQRNREYDARRRTERPWRAWYSTARWRALRATQLASQPLYERCKARGVIRPATVAHHITAHKGDEVLFWDTANLASSCADCHDTDEQRIERGGRARQTVGPDGWPVDQGCLITL